MSTIKERQNELLNKFGQLSNWEEKYKKIIVMGKDLADMPEKYKTEDKLVKGCQSRVWLFPETEGDCVLFFGDSDALIVKGILAMVLSIYNRSKPSDILNEPLFFLEELDLAHYLSPTRSNGLAAMIKQIKLYAMAMQVKLG